MSNPLRDALDRTLLLMRDELSPELPDARLVAALTNTAVTLVADGQNLMSHSAQTAFVTLALLLARSGHRVHLVAPDVKLAYIQPPLRVGRLIDGLLCCGADILPGYEFAVGPPAQDVDLCIVFGDSRPVGGARRVMFVIANDWSARIGKMGERWPLLSANPCGGMAASGFAAAEAFKIAMTKLRRFWRDPAMGRDLFKPVEEFSFDLAPATTPLPRNLGNFDLVSAGAITHSVLYALSRIPGAHGHGRVFDDDMNALTNLNRYMLLLSRFLGEAKVNYLAEFDLGGIRLDPVAARFHSTAHFAHPVPKRVLVGADHIPTRWEAQMLSPSWLGVGATTHWSAMASCHNPRSACAGCLHPRDDSDVGNIPTVAFVSFWAGLLLAVYFVREIAMSPTSINEQQAYLTPFRPESWWRSPVAIHAQCPIHGRRAA